MRNLNKKFSEFLEESEQIDKVTKGAMKAQPLKKLEGAEVQDLGGSTYDEPSGNEDIGAKASTSLKAVHDVVNKNAKSPDPMKKLTGVEPSSATTQVDAPKGSVTKNLVDLEGEAGLKPKASKEHRPDSFFEDLDEADEETLEELSDDTLKSYVKKSFQKDNIKKLGTAEKVNKRAGNLQKASDILKKRGVNEEKEDDKEDEEDEKSKKMKSKSNGKDEYEKDDEDEDKPKKKTKVEVSKKEYKPDMKEDVEVVFNGQTITEEVKEKTVFLIESAVKEKVKVVTAELEEAYTIKLQEEIEILKEEVENDIKGSLSYIVSEWLVENNIAIERGLRAEIMESFFTDLKDLFESHNIDIPVEKEDIVYNLSLESQEREASLNEQIEKNAELYEENIALQRKLIILEKTSGLADTQKEKIASLAEDVDFINSKNFNKKVDILIEAHCSVAPAKTSDILTSGDEEVKTTVVESKPVAKTSTLFEQMSKLAKPR